MSDRDEPQESTQDDPSETSLTYKSQDRSGVPRVGRGGSRDNRDVRTKQIEHLVSLGILPEREISGRLYRRKTTLVDADYAAIHDLASIGCSLKEIASVLGIATSTLDVLKRKQDVAAKAKGEDKGSVSLAIEHGREKMKMSIWRALFDKISKGSPACVIFAAKTVLGLVERRQVEHVIDQDISGLSDDQLAAAVARVSGTKGRLPEGPTVTLDSSTVTQESQPTVNNED